MEMSGQSCPRCGISGIHACPGKPIAPPTMEQVKAFQKAIDNIFKEDVMVDEKPIRLTQFTRDEIMKRIQAHSPLEAQRLEDKIVAFRLHCDSLQEFHGVLDAHLKWWEDNHPPE